MSNLLERLHASFFFYIMTTPSKFLKIGMYLPSAILAGASLMLGGLGAWVQARWIEVVHEDFRTDKEPKSDVPPRKEWVSRPRGLMPVLCIFLAAIVVGNGVFFTVNGPKQVVCLLSSFYV